MGARRCGICGESYQRGFFYLYNPHLEAVHPEYWLWFKRWRAGVLLSGIGAIPVLIILDLVSFQTHNSVLLLLTNGFYIVANLVLVETLPLALRKMKRKWKEEHGVS